MPLSKDHLLFAFKFSLLKVVQVEEICSGPISPVSQDHADLPLEPVLPKGLAGEPWLPHGVFVCTCLNSFFPKTSCTEEPLQLLPCSSEEKQRLNELGQREETPRPHRGPPAAEGKDRGYQTGLGGASNHTTSQVVCVCVCVRCAEVHNLIPTPLTVQRAHTLVATPAEPSTYGKVEGTQRHGHSQPEWPFSVLRRNRLTKCAGDGDLVSLTVLPEGTSRRGHFICRYCTGDRKHRAAGQRRLGAPRESGGALQPGDRWVRDVAHIHDTPASWTVSTWSAQGRAHMYNHLCQHPSPPSFRGDTHNPVRTCR